MIETTFDRIYRACSTRPIAFVYCLAAIMIALAFQNPLYIIGCIVVLGFAACAAIIYSQHDDLVARVAQLTLALEQSNTAVPRDPAKDTVS